MAIDLVYNKPIFVHRHVFSLRWMIGHICVRFIFFRSILYFSQFDAIHHHVGTR